MRISRPRPAIACTSPDTGINVATGRSTATAIVAGATSPRLMCTSSWASTPSSGTGSSDASRPEVTTSTADPLRRPTTSACRAMSSIDQDVGSVETHAGAQAVDEVVGARQLVVATLTRPDGAHHESRGAAPHHRPGHGAHDYAGRRADHNGAGGGGRRHDYRQEDDARQCGNSQCAPPVLLHGAGVVECSLRHRVGDGEVGRNLVCVDPLRHRLRGSRPAARLSRRAPLTPRSTPTATRGRRAPAVALAAVVATAATAAATATATSAAAGPTATAPTTATGAAIASARPGACPARSTTAARVAVPATRACAAAGIAAASAASPSGSAARAPAAIRS